jgi:hypothetical protein
MVRIIGAENMRCGFIGIGVDGHRSNSEFLAAPDDTDGDFSSIRDQQGSDRFFHAFQE